MIWAPGREPGRAGEAEAVREEDDGDGDAGGNAGGNGNGDGDGDAEGDGDGDGRGLALGSESDGSWWRRFWSSLDMTWAECVMAFFRGVSSRSSMEDDGGRENSTGISSLVGRVWWANYRVGRVIWVKGGLWVYGK